MQALPETPTRTRESLHAARTAAQPLRETISAATGAAVGAAIPFFLGGSSGWVVSGAAIGVVVGAILTPGWVAVRTFTSRTKRRVDALEARLADRPNSELANDLSDLAAEIASFHAKGREPVFDQRGLYRPESDIEYHARFNLDFDTRLRSIFAELKQAGIATDADKPIFHDAWSQTDVQVSLRDFSDRVRG